MKKMIRTLVPVLWLIPMIALSSVTVDGTEIPVVDPHLHFGNYSDMTKEGKEFLIAALPDFTRLYAPPIMDRAIDPYAENIGIASQLDMAGIDHGILLAAYTHHTTGYATNEGLLDHLEDSRNVLLDDGPLFWGMASINLDDFEDADTAASRLAALRSYLEADPDGIVGIKLAHAHQGVAFDDPVCDGIYDLAAEFGVPMMLHSGFSPVPNSMDSPEYYDPSYLETAVTAYDGQNGHPLVVFVLAHTGQGDKRSVNHALEMARDHTNVYIDLSALKRPFQMDENGNEISEEDQALPENATQLPYVLQKINEYNLIDKAIFSTDRPQYSGMLRSYLEYMVQEMQTAGLTVDEMRKILHDNAFEVFGLD